MSRRPSAWELDERRNARIRQLREQRESPFRRRRRVQPLLLLFWLAGTVALVGVLIALGFVLLFAPRLFAWVEENPGSVEHGLVQEFVEWYRPGELADEPASTERRRVTVVVEPGSNDAQIGQLLFDAGVIDNRLAFHYAVIQAGREGTLNLGTYDLSPTMRPSEIIDTLRGEVFIETAVTIREGLRLEEIVAAFGESEMTMNLEQLAALLEAPPPDLLNQFDYLNDLPDGRNLEGYLLPDTYRWRVAETPRRVVEELLTILGNELTPELRAAIAAKGLTIDQAIKIASIVEREAVLDEERPLIASVYINRIQNPDAAAGTVGLLNADPTLQYGEATNAFRIQQQLPVDSWGTVEWWEPLLVAGGEIGADWPPELAGYQTYHVRGLPPTPIAMPRIESIQAIASAPLDQGLYFFVAGCPNGERDGSHYFATDLGGHNANIARANEECAGQ